jgi:ABC-type branched-subunit amino acid transport system substrate-binding protein
MKRILSWLVLIGFAVAQISIIAPKFISAGSETMYMAVVGPMTGPDAARGKAMVDGATLMIDTLEESGILGDRDIQLIVKDDQSNPQIAMEHAAALAQDEQVMAVLGHSSDEISRATAPIYAAGGLPVVSGSSGLPLVAAENKWYFRVGLTTVQQGTFLANYMARVMQEDTLQIITAQDEYSLSLTMAVEDELWFLKRLGTARVEVSKKWSFDAAEGKRELDQIIDELSKTYTGGPLLVSVPTDIAAKVIQRIRDNPRLRFGKPLPYKIIGPDSLGRPELLSSLSTLNREVARPGYYTEGMLAVAPFLEDVANQKALDFREEFQKRHGQSPSVIAAGFHDAAQVVSEAMMKLTAPSTDIKVARAELREIMMKFDAPENAVSGVTGGLYFDRDGNAIKTVPIGVYRDRRLVSPPTQLSAVRDIETLGATDIYQIAGNYFTPTRIVHTGVRVNEIKDIDLANRRAYIDFNIWFRYPDEFDIRAMHRCFSLRRHIPLANKVSIQIQSSLST